MIEKPLSRNDMEMFLELFDYVQDAVMVGKLDEVTNLDPREMKGWLDDLSDSLHETIQELEMATA